MNEIITFILGSMLGCTLGVMYMCLLQVNKENDIERKYKKLLKEKQEDINATF